METEQTEVTTEPTEQVSTTEPAEKVSEKPEEVSEPTFKQEDIDKAVTAKLAEAETEWQSRKDTEFGNYQNKIKELETQSLNAQEAREIADWGDTEQTKEFQEARRAFMASKAEWEPKRLKVEEESRRNELVARGMRAKELADANGMDVNDLLKCKSPDEMNGLVEIWNRFKEKSKIDNSPVQVVDSGAPSAQGVDSKTLSPIDKITSGLKTEEKQRR